MGNAVSLLLDNVKYLRMSLAATTIVLGYAFSANMLAMRFFTSRWFWQQYPKWVKVVNLPLVLKFWGGKLVFQYLYGIYLKCEGHLLEILSDIETTLIEPRLPAENEESKRSEKATSSNADDYDDDDEDQDENED